MVLILKVVFMQPDGYGSKEGDIVAVEELGANIKMLILNIG